MREQHRILLVRNIGLGADIETTLFQRSAFHVVVLGDADSVIEAAAEETPHLVILGDEMPGLSGAETCARLKAAPGMTDVPVLIVVATNDAGTRESCRRAGADAVVSPSDGMDAVMSQIADVLGIAPRKPVRMMVLFTVESVGSKETIGRAVNLSEGGMGLEVNRHYGPDTEMRVRFQLPGAERRIEAAARVRWVSPKSVDVYAMGVEFTRVEPEHRRLLNGYIDRSLTVR